MTRQVNKQFQLSREGGSLPALAEKNATNNISCSGVRPLKVKISSAAERWINAQEISLTSQQRRVILWIARALKKGTKQTIICFYVRISDDLGITKKAVRSAVSALVKKKVLFDLGVACSPSNPRQAIGKRFKIPEDIYTLIEFQLQDHRM